MNFQSGILDKTRLMSNVLMLVLVAGNIFFSVQYTQSIKDQAAQANSVIDKDATRIQVARFLKYFIDTVLNTQGTIAFDDRVKLENDIRQIHDSSLTTQWTEFVNSKDSKIAQTNAVKLMSMLTNKML
ncbi:MAG: hypothetical protein PHG25_02190 [Candidatus Pacebacteria bacterium]|nr:hypothetical protein [Candidatus Paceibacterota bacterium]